MKINGHGQARILSFPERQLLLAQGFLCQRDRSINEVCYYLACRISEASQLTKTDVFNGNSVNDIIVLRKKITKAKFETRSIPTHPKLKASLEKYAEDSRELLRIKQIIGEWDVKSLTCGETISPTGEAICPKCAGDKLTTAGKSRGKQLFKCRLCSHRFQENPAFLKHPELKETVIRLGVYNSFCYGFLFADPENPYLFPGFQGKGYLCRGTALEIFRNACKRVSIVGAGTHSWRRTALTEMAKSGIPLRTIQKISGHRRLYNLQKYLEVSREQVDQAINALPFYFS